MPRLLAGLAVPLMLLIAGCSGGGAGGGAASGGAAGSVEVGKGLFTSKGCTACHTLAAAGSTATIGPNLNGIGAAAATRKPGVAAEAYIRESIMDPQAFISPGFTAPSPMPNGLATGKELDELVAFLAAQK